MARMVVGRVQKRRRIRNTFVAVSFSLLLPAAVVARVPAESLAYSFMESIMKPKSNLVIQPVVTEDVDTLIEVALSD